MSKFVTGETSVWTVIERQAGKISTISTLCTIAALLGVCAALAVSTAPPYNRGMLAILGGTLALTPYVLGRALQEAVRENQMHARSL